MKGGEGGGGAYNRTKKSGINLRFWEPPTYPFPRSTLTLTSHLGQNVGIGEG